MRPMTDWGGYTIGSFVPHTGSRTFADVAAMANPVAHLVQTKVNGPVAPTGRAIDLSGHRYGSHRGTDPYTPAIAAYALVPQPLQAADATTNPNKQSYLAGFTDSATAMNTAITAILNKPSSGQYK